MISLFRPISILLAVVMAGAPAALCACMTAGSAEVAEAVAMQVPAEQMPAEDAHACCSSSAEMPRPGDPASHPESHDCPHCNLELQRDDTTPAVAPGMDLAGWSPGPALISPLVAILPPERSPRAPADVDARGRAIFAAPSLRALSCLLII
ncbi:MAG: hypothetical protein ACOCTI_02455 [Phycisphaeraceae bacterium]